MDAETERKGRADQRAIRAGIDRRQGGPIQMNRRRLGCVAFQAVLGSALQDRKLAARMGTPYEDYCAKTSAVPLAAILRGRARVVARDQPWLAYGAGLLVAWLLREAHSHLFDFYGGYIVAVTLGGAALATRSAERQARATRPEMSLG